MYTLPHRGVQRGGTPSAGSGGKRAPKRGAPEGKIDPGGYRWPPTFSNWLKTTFSGNFDNLLFLAGFNFRGHFEGLNEGFSRLRFSMITKGMIEPPK
jgi:hypothetical protein